MIKDVWLRFDRIGRIDRERLLDALLGASCPDGAAIRLIDQLQDGGLSFAERPVSPNVHLRLLRESLEHTGVTIRVIEGDTRTVDITADGRNVWVNSPEGLCIGRFGYTIDIHQDIDAQLEDQKHCLDCRHRSDDLDSDWRFFKDGMRQHHRVEVSDHHKPDI